MPEYPDLANWLKHLDLAKYVPLFVENEIDWAILPDLSDDDLKELGLPLGPRRKIQKALAELQRDAAGSETTQTAERRHLTVMFADLVGSSEMSTKMDPEELRGFMREFQQASKSAIERYQGYVARYMGDGILAYFGYPQAHENDPERSVRAGLELLKQATRLNDRPDLPEDVRFQVRVGIATGAVVVGDLIGEGSSAERAVVGETPNIAARIESSAPTNSVVVAHSTHELLGAQFETEELESIVPKGFTTSFRLFRILAEKRVESRFKATRTSSDTPFVGRSAEIETLQTCWSKACSSSGSGMLICGEAGVGKSRFLHEFLHRISSSDSGIIQFQCSTFHTNTAFYPIVEQYNALTKMNDALSIDERRARLQKLLLPTARPPEESLQLLASLLSVSVDGSLPSTLENSPPQLLDAIHELIIEQILARSEAGPVLVIFEDAHWMDPTTAENVVRLSRACANSRLFVVATSRPNNAIEKILGASLPVLELSGLSKDDAAALVRSVRDAGALTPTAFNAVLERTDGIPLFIEELTKLVLERGDGGDTSESSIPTTLVDSLTERLDRLGSCKELASLGATIGRKFSFDLLRRIDKRADSVLQADIKRLIDAELIEQIGRDDKPVYWFKHALVQDAAYGTLLYSKRRQHHAQIADTLLEAFPDTARDNPELLALHLYEGGRPLEAVDYWQIAGRDATRRSANTEAVNHLSTAIKTLRVLAAESPQQLQKELELLIALGAPLVAARGYASDELEAAYSRALEIGENLHEGINSFRVLWGLSSFYLIRGQLPKSLEIQQQCSLLAKRNKSADESLHAASWLGTILFYNNDFDEAEHWLDQALVEYRADAEARHGYQYGLDPAVLARVHLTWLYWLRGNTERAFSLDEETLAFAESLNHPLSYVHALNFSVVLHSFEGNFEESLIRANLLLSLSSQREFPHYIAYSRFMRGLAVARLESYDDGVAQMVEGLKARRETGAELARPMFLTMLADVLADAGQYLRSVQLLDEADAIVASNGERWYEAETQRVRATVLNQQTPGSGNALECVQCSLEMSGKNGFKRLEMRALTSLLEIQDAMTRDAPTEPELLRRLAKLVDELPCTPVSPDVERSRLLLSSIR